MLVQFKCSNVMCRILMFVGTMQIPLNYCPGCQVIGMAVTDQYATGANENAND